jgi:predicted nucleic acid-binding protein
LDQPRTERARELHEQDPDLVVWWGSPVECASAFARLRRDGILDPDDEHLALSILAALQDAWYEIQPGDGLRTQALRLLRLHPLRAADSLQLAAGLEWAGVPPTGEFVTFDQRLGAAARREGFRLV